VEQIFKKVRGRKLTDFPDIGEMTDHVWSIVHTHCSKEFYDSWESIARMSTDVISEEVFFRNYLWCVYVSGFSAKAVTANYDRLLAAHNLVDSTGTFIPSMKMILPDHDNVFKIWRNQAKFKAIHTTRLKVAHMGWINFRKHFLDARDPGAIQSIAFMGPALSRHLARNLGGVQIVKPDVHLVRLARHFMPGQDMDPVKMVENLCRLVARTRPVMDSWPLGKVDLLLWYASATLRS
jgi:hypothetical protein